MGRRDGRDDPRVRRPIRGKRFEPLSWKRSEAVKRVHRAVVITVLLAVVSPAVAQEAKRLEPGVVTATKLEEPGERLGATVTVINDDDLELYHHETGGEPPRQVAGGENK